MKEGWIVRTVLLAAALAAVAFAATRLRDTHDKISLNVDEIEEQIAALDPVTRAGVAARLTADAAKSVHEQVSH
jgi:hypothetical protein